MHDLKSGPGRKQPADHGEQVVVCPPSQERIEHYARQVCRQLSQRMGTDFCEAEVQRGFAGFVKIVVRIRARQLGATYEEEKQSEARAA